METPTLQPLMECKLNIVQSIYCFIDAFIGQVKYQNVRSPFDILANMVVVVEQAVVDNCIEI